MSNVGQPAKVGQPCVSCVPAGSPLPSAGASGACVAIGVGGAFDYLVRGKLFGGFLDGLPEGAVVMCHPGIVDDILRGRDRLTDRREVERAFLAGDEMPRTLARAGLSLS